MTEPAHNRQSMRLPGYDYAEPGGYFVTIVTQSRVNRFGEIQNGSMVINDAGSMVEACWLDLPGRFPRIELDEYVIMPNHFHGIIFIVDKPVGAAPPALHQTQCGASVVAARPAVDTSMTGAPPVAARPAVDARRAGTSPAPTGDTLGDVVGAFKSITTHEYITGVKELGWPAYDRRLWQRNYYEHVIRDEAELQRVRQYIHHNPQQWELDKENPQRGNP